MPTNFVINAADLAYILRQIKIGEASSIGYTPDVAPVSILQAIMNEYGISATNAAQLPAGLRTVDGTYNNLVSAATTEFGAADTLFPRLTDPVFQTVDGPGIDFNGDGIFDVINHNYGDASALAGYQLRSVADNDPRTISNLIVDMSVNNPAAIATFINNPISAGEFEEEMGFAPTAAWFTNPANAAAGNEWLQTIPNLSPDIGLSPGFNSWMTFFGQFFDHGLDLVTKGSNGTVYIPLQSDDPLYDKGKDGIANNVVNVYFVSDPSVGTTLPATSVTPTAWQAFYVSNPASSPVGAPPPALTATNTGFAVKFNDDGFGADGKVGTADDRPNFMALTRATATIVNGVPQHENTTTSWIDQNQTYTSHASHQVFLREYVKDAAGHAVSTGRLLDGTAASGSVAGAIGNWAEVKAQAKSMLGIILSDIDVHNVPLLLTDQYGKFIPGANGYAQLVMAPDATHANVWYKEGTATGITTAGSVGTNHAFLNDIAHHAAPAMFDTNGDGRPDTWQHADTDPGVGDDGDASTYDDEMLNAHFITGDGRGNENIALTTVHSIFHSEHNRIVEANKATLIDTALSGRPEDLAFLNEWLLVDVTSVPSDLSTLVWDGERLFQAARFGTEMQYQHLVFEEFARRIQPMVDPFVFNNSPNIDPSIVAEFAHTVYRFGHSMLTGTVDRLENDLTAVGAGDPDQKSLLAVFLNPQAYVASGTTLEQINANVIRGLSRDVGNAMDEFIVTDVRSNLLGLPLDLGALNIARGRDTGIPSLNETRRQLYDDSGLADLKPYESWADFAANLKNASSVVNFIAAYGTHSSITSATTMAAKRIAADKLVFGGSGAPSDRLDFIYATGAYAPDGSGPHDDTRGGLELIDLWIGGLAEASPEFGGMLGTTFNYVFEAQMENLQNGDRMYYLSRTQGQNFLNQLEPNTFADLVMRNTDLGDKYSTHLNGALFTTPDLFLELDRGIAQTDYDPGSSSLDPDWDAGEPHSPFDQKVTRTYSGVKQDGTHDFGGTMRYIGGQHVVMGGTEGADKMWGDRGIDTLWGDGGDDYLNAGTESDDVFGGEGDDIIEDPFGDDLLRGNAGNDVISSARGIDILFGNEGKDAIFVGQDASEVFAGSGNDFVLGGAGGDSILGNEGDDWLEGGAGFDTLTGDNSELFFNSLIIGHDVMFAHADEVDYDAESGDDIMGSGPSVFRYEGMFGFDWAIAKGDIGGVNHDLRKGIFTNVPDDILRDRFDKVEALSGYHFDDTLQGDDRGHIIPGAVVTGRTVDATFFEDVLNQEGIDRIHGFGDWFGTVRQTLFGGPTPLVPGTEVATSFRDGNILLGGDGNDTIQGRGGFDLIDGDAYLNVRILITTGSGANIKYYSAESLNTDTSVAGPYAGRVFEMVGNDPEGDVNFAAGPAFGGRSLQSLLLDRTINPAQMSIVREIKYDATDLTGASQNFDTAVFYGTLAEYDIEGRTVDANGIQLTAASDVNRDGFISVHDRDDGVTGATVVINGVTTTLDSRRTLVDDTDFLKNVEELRFADQTLILSGPHVPKPPAVDLHAFELVTTNTQYLDQFQAVAYNNSNGTTPWATSWAESGDGANAVGGGQIQINVNATSGVGRLVFNGGTNATTFDGASITRAVNLSGLGSTTLSFDYGFANIDTGERLFVEFARDGVNFVNIGTIDGGATAVDASLAGTSGTFTTTVLGGNSAALLRFTSTAMNATNEVFRVDNVSFTASTTAQVAANDGNGFTSTFTENGAGAAIARNAVITDPDSANMLRAQIRLTNAQALDALTVAGALPAGITSSVDTSVAGVITLTLSGMASLASYQTAIQQVRFSSSSENPNLTPRTIEVTVNDGQANSPVAVATVNIVAVNDAPVAVADTVITNIAGGNIVIPEWALLANDTDIEGNALDVTAVSAAVGVTGLSLATNPGSVTLVDDATAGGSFTYSASDGALTGNAGVTLTRQGTEQVADNFNGAGAVRSAANNSTGTVAWTTSWTELGDGTNTLQTGQVQIDGAGGNGTNQLRFLNGDGASITRAVNLAGASNAVLTFDFDKNGIDIGESVRVQFAADGDNFLDVDGGLITNTNGTNANGNAAGTLSLALTGALGANSAIRFVGSGISTVGEDIRIDNLRIDYTAANATITGTANGEILVGNGSGSILNALGGADRIFAGAGDDTVNAGAGDDVISWSVGDGRDFVDGGANGTAGDRFVVNGDDTVEDYKVYARAEALAANIVLNNANTEMVILRNGVVIAELDNVEEVTINTAGGADTTEAIGNFNPSSLFFNTITVNGGTGPDKVDSTQLTSAHRLVLNQDGTVAAVQPADPFPAVGQSLIDALGRKGLLDSGDAQGFLGSRHNGTLMSSLLGDDHVGGRHFYEMTHSFDLAVGELAETTNAQPQALHFDAADHLIS
jgi:Ca2+-binding RTX toxin-like protein